ncbi:MAG: alpha/beta hydrolase, partial [Bacteroidetes bacterium]|nr:alpha/beta hydrolase [Bacteroidota bacterium]
MKRSIGFILVIALLMSMFSCDKQDVLPVSVINQLQVEGAVLPVHMHGNQESNVAVIVVHGGPGESAILKRNAVGLHRLESEHLMVYYDQRGCGISEGNVDEASMSVEQMAKDLHAVVQMVLATRGVDNIFIMSLDWGSATVVNYLTGSLTDGEVKGYVAVSPAFNAEITMKRSVQEIIDIAEELLDDSDPTNDELAENILIFYDQNSIITKFNYEEHYRLVEAIRGIVLFDDVEFSEAEFPAYINSSLENNELFALSNWTYNNEDFLQTLDVEGDLRSIEVPVKIIWGFWDRLFPVSLADNYENSFGPASSREITSVFPFSAHRPYLEEGE